MGWSSGAELASKLIKLVENLNQGEEKIRFYNQMIDIFEDFDCDNLNECVGESAAFDYAYKMNYDDKYGEGAYARDYEYNWHGDE